MFIFLFLIVNNNWFHVILTVTVIKLQPTASLKEWALSAIHALALLTTMEAVVLKVQVMLWTCLWTSRWTSLWTSLEANLWGQEPWTAVVVWWDSLSAPLVWVRWAHQVAITSHIHPWVYLTHLEVWALSRILVVLALTVLICQILLCLI